MKRSMFFLWLCLAQLLSAQDNPNQLDFQLDTITPENGKLEMQYLQEGLHRYLVYIEKPDQSLLNMTIWDRTVKFKQGEIEITQEWRSQDTTSNRTLLSRVHRSDFASIYHYSSSPKGGTEAFNFSTDHISGADSVISNKRKDFNLATAQMPFNWELDLEIFPLLPFKEQTTFVIPFYHPGSKTAPTFYQYKVIGSEQLKLPGGGERLCWMLNIDYSKGNQATFWIDQQTREVLKMEEHYGPIKRFKFKLMNI